MKVSKSLDFENLLDELKGPPLWADPGDYRMSGVDTEKLGQYRVSKRSLGVKISHHPEKTLKNDGPKIAIFELFFITSK